MSSTVFSAKDLFSWTPVPSTGATPVESSLGGPLCGIQRGTAGRTGQALGGRSQPEKGKIKIIFDNVL